VPTSKGKGEGKGWEGKGRGRAAGEGDGVEKGREEKGRRGREGRGREYRHFFLYTLSTGSVATQAVPSIHEQRLPRTVRSLTAGRVKTAFPLLKY